MPVWRPRRPRQLPKWRLRWHSDGSKISLVAAAAEEVAKEAKEVEEVEEAGGAGGAEQAEQVEADGQGAGESVQGRCSMR